MSPFFPTTKCFLSSLLPVIYLFYFISPTAYASFLLFYNNCIIIFVIYSVLFSFPAEKMKLLEEKDEVKESATATSSRTDRIVAEMEEIRLKMMTIEQEKLSLQATVSNTAQIQ